MAEFLSAYAVVMKNEGGYSNRAADKGGETYAGISRKWHPIWKGWDIVDKYKPLKQGQHIKNTELSSLIKQFYKMNFWDAIKGDYIDSQRIATFVFDWQVTSWDDAVKALQRAANVVPDGKIGSKTILAVNEADEGKVVEQMKTARKEYYRQLVVKDPNQRANLKGWLNRVDSF